jgi:predicted transcriptional regulator
LRTIRILKEMVKPTSPGPMPSFTEYHLIRALILIGSKGNVGRGTLSSQLGLGEGSGRTIIEHLKQAGLVAVAKEGCKLTKKGEKMFREIKSRITDILEIDETGYELGQYNVGILVKDSADNVNLGIEQRDAAVKAGATGAITLVFKDSVLQVPPSGSEARSKWPKPTERLEDIFKPHESDVIILCGAETKEIAENGVLAAASTLLKN